MAQPPIVASHLVLKSWKIRAAHRWCAALRRRRTKIKTTPEKYSNHRRPLRKLYSPFTVFAFVPSFPSSRIAAYTGSAGRRLLPKTRLCQLSSLLQRGLHVVTRYRSVPPLPHFLFQALKSKPKSSASSAHQTLKSGYQIGVVSPRDSSAAVNMQM